MNSRFAFGIAFLVLFLSFAGCTHTTPPVELLSKPERQKDWGKTSPKPWDLARHHIDGEKPFEWWYFDGHLDNGEIFVGVFQVPSFVSGDIEVIFTLYSKDWTREFHIAKLKAEEISVSYDDLHIETPVGFVRRMDDHIYHVKWEMDDIVADFTLTTLAPGWMPGDRHSRVNRPENQFFWAVHQGRNRIEGTLTRNGVTKKVTGVGYADHNWGKKPLHKITRKWTWGRIIAGEYTIIYADVDYYEPGLVLNPLYIAKGDELFVGSGSPFIRQWDYETHDELKRHFPRQVHLGYESDRIQASVHIKKKRMVENHDLLESAGYKGIMHWLVSHFFSRPTYFRIIADFDGTIQIDGEKETISGECLYEVMGFE
jgi:hypothetical protein